MVRFWLKEILLSLLKIKHFNIIHDTSTKIETLLHFDLITHMLILFWERGGGPSPCIETRVNSTTYSRIIIKLCHLASNLNISCHYWIRSLSISLTDNVCVPWRKGGVFNEIGLKKIWIFFLLMRRYPTKRAFFFISGPSLQIFPLIRYQIENNCVKLSIGMVNKIRTVTSFGPV